MIQEIDRRQMEQLVSEGAQLVDVREQDELSAGTIPGYTHMPLSTFEDHKHKLSSDRPIVFYCRSGRRSVKSAELAREWGFTNPLYSLRGGYMAYSGEED